MKPNLALSSRNMLLQDTTIFNHCCHGRYYLRKRKVHIVAKKSNLLNICLHFESYGEKSDKLYI